MRTLVEPCPLCLYRHEPAPRTAEVVIDRYLLHKLPGRYRRVATRWQYVIRWDGHQSDQGSVLLADVRRKARRLADGRPVVERWGAP